MLAEQLAVKINRTPQRQEQTLPAETLRDFDLVRRIAGGDESALQDLYAAYGQRLYAYALRLTADPAQAEDIVQDALLAVWQSAGTYRAEGRLVAWLMGIVHHTALKSMRSRCEPISGEMEDCLPDTGSLPEEQAQSGEQSDWIRRGLEKLSPEHRSVLELVFYQGLTLQETARVCNCPPGTVKSRLNYARRYLRGILSRMEENR